MKSWKMEQEEEHQPQWSHADHDKTRIIDTIAGSIELLIFKKDNASDCFTLARARNGSSQHFSGDQT
ncbi:hypothetical protein ACKU0N_024475 [Enterobacter hormaechei]